MQDTEKVTQQLRSLPFVPILTGYNELSLLPQLLDSDEQILALSAGLFEKYAGLIALTHKRLIFLDGRPSPFFIMEIPLLELEDISYSMWYGSGNLLAHAFGKTISFHCLTIGTEYPIATKAMIAKKALVEG